MRRVLVACCVITTFLLAGCGKKPGSLATDATSPAPAAAAPKIIHPEQKTVRHRIEQPGFNIEAFQETPLYSRIEGYVLNWDTEHADIGGKVKKNQTLAELYVPERKAEVRQKEAAVQQAEAQVAQAKAAVLTNQALVDRMKSQYARLEKIGEKGTIDKESVEETRLGYESAQASLKKAEADVKAAQAHQEVTKANLDYARAMLAYAEIKAPYDGVVSARNVNTGDFVQPAGGNAHRPLFVIMQTDPVRVFVNIPGSDAPWVHDGESVSLLLQGSGGKVLNGKVSRNSKSLSARERTLRTEIDLPNPDGKLLPGMYVHATILVQHPNVWTLPKTAIRTEGDDTFCFRVVDGKAVRTPLQLGLAGDGLVEVLKMRIREPGSSDAGDWTAVTGKEDIVAGDVDTLTEGQAIKAAEK
jgi:multidrug efflux pump subunit AcrA (membrane-fusion protein)